MKTNQYHHIFFFIILTLILISSQSTTTKSIPSNETTFSTTPINTTQETPIQEETTTNNTTTPENFTDTILEAPKIIPPENTPQKTQQLTTSLTTQATDCYDTSIQPIPLCTCIDLNKTQTNLSGNYVLNNTIDCSDTVNWNAGAGFDPIGNNINPFVGTFNGQGYNITDLFMTSTTADYRGLIGFLNTTGNISNVGMVDVNITGDDNVGGLVGTSRGIINNSFATGYRYGLQESSGEGVGGLVGRQTGGVINNSYAEGIVTTNTANNWNAGGLVGWAQPGTIDRSYSTANVSSRLRGGGLVGTIFGGEILNSYATGTVTGNSNQFGGLAGVVGSSSNPVLINNTYARGNVSSPTGTSIGGLVGTISSSTVMNSYATGIVEGSSSESGLVDSASSSTCTNTFWDNETSDVFVDDCGATGKTTAEMTNVSTFTDTATVGLTSAWDFQDNPNNDSTNNDDWGISAGTNNGYPVLVGIGAGVGVLNPIVTLNTPADNNYFSETPTNITFNCSVTTTQTLANISLYLTDNTNNSFALNQTKNLAGTSNSSNWTVELGAGNYSWSCESYDTESRQNIASNRSISSDQESPTFTDFTNQSIVVANAVAYDINATDVGAGVDCFTVNDTTSFAINCSGYLENATNLAAQEYYLNITVNDTAGNNNSDILLINITPVSSIGISLIYPTEDGNVTYNETFNVTINVTCVAANCGAINVSLDPQSETIQNGNFETGDLTNWLTGGNTNWAAQTTTVYEGSNAAKAGTITHNQNSWISQNVTLTETANLTFKWKVSSETNFDFLGFCDNKSFGDSGCTRTADDIPSSPISGTKDWALIRYQLSPGTHQLLWFYAKDGSVNTGSDTGWIDNISILTTTAAKSGLVSTTQGDTPFWTNTTNPYNTSLSEGESETIIFWVNATGDINTSHNFFAYANQTADQSINNITTTINLTIREKINDTTNPEFSDLQNQTIEFGSSLLYDINATDVSGIDCFRINNTNNFSINCSGILQNISQLDTNIHHLNITVNDTAGNNNSDILLINVSDTTSPLLIIISPANNTNTSENKLNITYTATDLALSTCMYSNNSMSTNITLDSCANITNITWPDGPHNVSIWANDTSGNENNTNITFTIDTTSPSITLLSPLNNTGNTNGNITFSFNVTDTNIIANCSLSLNNIVNQTNTTINKDVTQNFNLTNISRNKYNWTISCADNSLNEGNATRKLTVIKALQFSNGTTNLSNVNISNITNLIITTQNKGLINFSNNIDLTNFTDLDSFINITNNKITIESDNISVLNTSATLTLYNLSFTTPRLLKDGTVCDSSICTQIQYTGGNLVFNVTHFTSYSAEETPIVNAATPAPYNPSTGGGGGGGGGSSFVAECTRNDECSEDKACFAGKCVKLFDIKITEVESPISLDGLLSFTYFLKGMANINNDVIINFRLEKDGKVISKGTDTIYIGSFEEKIEQTQLYIPEKLITGAYDFTITVTFEDYTAISQRTIFAEQQEEKIMVKLQELAPSKKPPYTLAGFIFLIILGSVILFIYHTHYLTNKKIKHERIQGIVEAEIEKRKTSITQDSPSIEQQNISQKTQNILLQRNACYNHMPQKEADIQQASDQYK
jgi:hypothetical protein